MGFFKKTASGLAWMGLLRVMTRILVFVKLALIARLLGPTQFGIFGIVTLALAFLEITTETGINTFLIQGEGKIKDYINTAWVMSIIRGLIITIIIICLASYISIFFKSPESRNLLILVSIVPFLRGFINPAIIMFRKELKFHKEFYFRFTSFFIDSIVSVSLALYLRTAESLVWGLVAAAFTELLISFLVINKRPRLSINLQKARKIISRGKWVTMSGLFEYLYNEGDDIIVGRILNTTSLGLYRVAYKISTLPLTEVTDVIRRVTFPVYSKISFDKERLYRAYLKSAIFVTVLVIPFGLIIYYFSEQIVNILLGSGWEEAVGIIKVLSIYGIFKAIGGINTPLFFSMKRQEYPAIINFTSIVLLIALIFPMIINFGILGAAYSTLIVSIITLIISFFFVLRLFKEVLIVKESEKLRKV